MPTLLEKPPRQPYSFVGTLKTPGSGRKRGTPNQLHSDAKWCVNEVFRLCGGVDGMLRWAKESPSEFYPLFIRSMVPKPIEISGAGDQQITLVIQRLSEPLPVVVSPPSLEHRP